MRLRTILILGTLALIVVVEVLVSHVYLPVPVEQGTLHDITQIADPKAAQLFFGTLRNLPHTYEIRSAEPFHLALAIRVPDTETARNTVSGILIQEVGDRGRVKEVTRLLAMDASWESVYDPWTGDTYRTGGTYAHDLSAGVYRIEVSTPNNLEPYMLMVGYDTSRLEGGYIARLTSMLALKSFAEQSSVSIMLSPLVYVPLCILLSIGALIVFMRTRTRASSN